MYKIFSGSSIGAADRTIHLMAAGLTLLSIIMLRNMFGNVCLSIDDGAMTLYVDADV